KFPRLVGDRGERGVLRLADDPEAGRERDDAVAMAHPDLVALARLPDAVIERARLFHLDESAAELPDVLALDLAAELMRHRLLAVTDAEDWHAGAVDGRRRQRCALVEHG